MLDNMTWSSDYLAAITGFNRPYGRDVNIKHDKKLSLDQSEENRISQPFIYIRFINIKPPRE